jgi:hypothetical protein
MSHLLAIIHYARATAIADALAPDEEANWRTICRGYSKNFHTPLHLVLAMDPEYVARAYFEDQMDDMDTDKEIDNLLDIIYTIEDPSYESEKREDLKDFMRETEKQELERLKAKKPIHPGLKAEDEVSTKNTPEKITPEVPLHERPDRPTSGGINLAYLSDNDSEE